MNVKDLRPGANGINAVRGQCLPTSCRRRASQRRQRRKPFCVRSGASAERPLRRPSDSEMAASYTLRLVSPLLSSFDLQKSAPHVAKITRGPSNKYHRPLSCIPLGIHTPRPKKHRKPSTADDAQLHRKSDSPCHLLRMPLLPRRRMSSRRRRNKEPVTFAEGRKVRTFIPFLNLLSYRVLTGNIQYDVSFCFTTFRPSLQLKGRQCE